MMTAGITAEDLAHISRSSEDIRKELGVTPVPAPDLWSDTNRLCDEGHPDYGQTQLQAAE